MSKCGNCCYGVMTGPNRMFCSVQNCLCEEVFDCEDYEPIVKPQTNADRIRAMTDEELARFIALQRGWYCEFKDPEDDEYPKVLEWLKQEVRDGKD